MLPFDRATILEGARRRGVHAGYFEKAVRLLHLLDLLGQDPYLKGKLSLRGGTAINLFYLPGTRLTPSRQRLHQPHSSSRFSGNSFETHRYDPFGHAWAGDWR